MAEARSRTQRSWHGRWAHLIRLLGWLRQEATEYRPRGNGATLAAKVLQVTAWRQPRHNINHVMEGFVEFATGRPRYWAAPGRAMAREAEPKRRHRRRLSGAIPSWRSDPGNLWRSGERVVGNQHHLYLDAQALNQSGLAEAAAESYKLPLSMPKPLQQGGDFKCHRMVLSDFCKQGAADPLLELPL